ncbi:MAG: hydroxyacid dehydrogenase [Opitutaceae bacterium]|nr:hydroxyacid dehydrogenase [Opitutaceae bacterium]
MNSDFQRAMPAAAFLLPPDVFELVYGDECLEAIGAQSALISDKPLGPHEPHPEWMDRLGGVELLFTGWHSPRLDDALLKKLPRLRAVFHAGGTIRQLVSETFWSRAIPISTASAANAVPVAEFTLGAILLSLKHAWVLNRQVCRDRAFPRTFPHVPGVRGATVGLVSLGLIGREVLRLLRSFDVRIIAHDPHLPPGRFRELGAEPVSMEDLMERSDVVSLHTPLNAETTGFINGPLLRRLKQGATFINTARGGLVCEPELIAFLQDRPDVQAVLDVTCPEPPLYDSPLYDLPNVFLTPHIAGSLGPECRRLGWSMVEEFRRFVQGEPLRHAVSREAASLQT